MATARLVERVVPGGDGGPLYVDLRTAARPGEPRPAVVIVHGFKGFKDWGFFPRLAERLAVAGCSAWSMNLSSSGVSKGDVVDQPERFAHQRPSADLADVAAVVDLAVAEGASAVGLVGHSRGGALAIIQAARDARVKALVTWAAIDSFMRWSAEDMARWRREGRIDIANARTGQVLPILTDALGDWDAHGAGLLDVMRSASGVASPWLIAHGAADPTVEVEAARRLAASGAARAELLLLEGADHTFGVRHPWAGSAPDYDELSERTVGFLARHLG